MTSFDLAILDLGRLDSLSYEDTIIHRLDPRAKLLATITFVMVVVSFPKYALTSLIPFFFFPILMVYMANLPFGFLIKKLLVVSPFALCIGIFNPFLDREVLIHLGSTGISGGWISFGSVMLRFVLTVGAALILIATTSFPGICNALERLKVPKLFVVQLMLLYRFVFVLTEEALRLIRARSMRGFGKKGPDVKLFIQMIGLLFLRTLGRAERVYLAMRNRGFDGEIRTIKRLRFTSRDAAFLALCVSLFLIFRFYDVSGYLGALVFRAFL